MSEEKFWIGLKMIIPIVIVIIVAIYGMLLTQTPEGLAAGQTPGGFLAFFGLLAFVFFCTPLGWIVGGGIIIWYVLAYIRFSEIE